MTFVDGQGLKGTSYDTSLSLRVHDLLSVILIGLTSSITSSRTYSIIANFPI